MGPAEASSSEWISTKASLCAFAGFAKQQQGRSVRLEQSHVICLAKVFKYVRTNPLDCSATCWLNSSQSLATFAEIGTGEHP